MTDFTVYTRTESKFIGRLLAMPTNANLLRDYKAGEPNRDILKRGSSSGLASVEFPCMPDEIQLDRRAQYTVLPNMVAPDGFHMYQYTVPLEIPVRFSLHGSDKEYCLPGGPATLLAVAARLHSFVLPLNPGKNILLNVNHVHSNQEAVEKSNSVKASNTPKTGGSDNENTLTEGTIKPTLFGQQSGRPPVTCILELIRISDRTDRMGIHCRGYVKEVTVKFHGPWMRGSGQQFNVPTSAEYGFTFVHLPDHQNTWGTMQKATPTHNQAYANDVIDTFYNTVALNSVLAAQGFDLGAPEVEQPTASTATTAAAPAPAPLTPVQAIVLTPFSAILQAPLAVGLGLGMASEGLFPALPPPPPAPIVEKKQ